VSGPQVSTNPLSRREVLELFGFEFHAGIALAIVACLNFLIAKHVPFAIEKIEQSYLIFYYHLPAALSCLVFFSMTLVASIAVLVTGHPAWDRRARTAAGVGLLACTITLTTGSTWASAAWNTWWDWGDARLMSAAVMWLTYAGYVLLQAQIEDAARRRRFAAVFGILAFVNIPLVHWAIEWFGETHHPESFQDLASDPRITQTRWFGVLAFFVFYLLLYRWRLAREETKERLESVLARVRRIEEGASA
jgi:heme exporter protein C